MSCGEQKGQIFNSKGIIGSVKSMYVMKILQIAQ
jgi:hypothetical protein